MFVDYELSDYYVDVFDLAYLFQGRNLYTAYGTIRWRHMNVMAF